MHAVVVLVRVFVVVGGDGVVVVDVVDVVVVVVVVVIVVVVVGVHGYVCDCGRYGCVC